ncbi:MAG: ferrochelatase [Acidobacteriota bacterium]|nr:ferrochelatase [Acidobacteriota bacterium]
MTSTPDSPFHGHLLIAFGGPQGMNDIRPFLGNVLRGRNVPTNRVEAVAKHYELFEGVSPITELTQRQANGLANRLTRKGLKLPVYVGMRNWNPYLKDTLLEISRAGIRRVIGFIMAPHGSFSSCEQYRNNVNEARQSIINSGEADVAITYVPSWHTHPGFIRALANHLDSAILALPTNLQQAFQIVFTAHSIPMSMANNCRYEDQLMESCGRVAQALNHPNWSLVYQSRSGNPADPWLGPDVTNHLRDQHASGLKAAVLCPIGFVVDHIEVLYDLDLEAAKVCEQIGLPVVRAAAVNDEALFLDMMTEVVTDTVNRYARTTPLPLTRPPK